MVLNDCCLKRRSPQRQEPGSGSTQVFFGDDGVKGVQMWWLVIAPAALLTAVASAMASWVGAMSGTGLSAVWTHLAFVLSCVFGLIGLTWLMGPLIMRWRYGLLPVLGIGFSLGVVFALFYVGLAFALYFLGEVPTRHLVRGYLQDVPAMFQAAPLGGFGRAGIVVAAAAFPLAAGLVIAKAFTTVARASAASTNSSAWLAAAVRASTYLGMTYALLNFTLYPSWALDAREPIASSWHNVSVHRTSSVRPIPDSERHADAAARKAFRGVVPKRKPNVVLIYVDALRADATEPYGSPAARKNMPFMADQVRAGVFRQVDITLAACSGTVCGIAALLQSRPTWLQSPDFYSLQHALGDVGYRTAFVLASNHQDFLNLRAFYGPVDLYLDGKDLDPGGGLDDRVVDKGLARLGSWDGRPTFLMIGLVSPHSLARRLPQHRVFLPDFDSSGSSAPIVEKYGNNYHNGVRQADAFLERIWHTLKTNGYLDDAIVVITSDHGESLGEHGYMGHFVSLNQPELHIPLWIHETVPTIEETRFARQIDVAPTIVSALGLTPPATWRGQSLQRAIVDAVSEHYSPNRRDLVAVVHFDGRSAVKLLFDRASTREVAYEVFADPGETVDVLGTLPAERARLLRSHARDALLGEASRQASRTGR